MPRRYPTEFRRKVLDLVEAGRAVAEVAEELGVSPGEVLFVGDTFDADVTGPQSVGMPCAWLNRKGAPVPEGCKPPDFEIEDLKDTLSILGL